MVPSCGGATSRSMRMTRPSKSGAPWKRRSRGDVKRRFCPSPLREGSVSVKSLRQQPTRSGSPEPFSEHVLGIHHFGEAGLVDPHGRDDGGRPRLGLAITHAVVRVLERQADERFEAGRYQIIFTPQRVPWRDPPWISRRELKRDGAARFHVQRFGNRRPHILPCED